MPKILMFEGIETIKKNLPSLSDEWSVVALDSEEENVLIITSTSSSEYDVLVDMSDVILERTVKICNALIPCSTMLCLKI